MVVVVRCPNVKCRKYMMVELTDQGRVLPCLVCQEPVRVPLAAGGTPPAPPIAPVRPVMMPSVEAFEIDYNEAAPPVMMPSVEAFEIDYNEAAPPVIQPKSNAKPPPPTPEPEPLIVAELLPEEDLQPIFDDDEPKPPKPPTDAGPTFKMD